MRGFLVLGGVLLTVLGLATMHWLWPGMHTHDLLAIGLYICVPILALVGIAVSLRRITAPRDRVAWIVTALSIPAFSLYWLSAVMPDRAVLPAPWTDGLFLLSFGLIWVGMLARPGSYPADLLDKLVVLLDVLISLCAAVAITIQLSLPELITASDASMVTKIRGLTYPLIALVTLVCINLLLVQTAPRQHNAPRGLMVLGVGLLLMGGLWSIYLKLADIGNVPFLCSTLWPVGFLCYAWAAHLEARSRRRVMRFAHDSDPFPSILSILVPIILVLAAMVLALQNMINPYNLMEPQGLIVSLASLAVLVTLAMVRHIMSFESNRRLYVALQYMYSEMARTASTDSLTGLANHGSFMERLDQELQRARRYHHAMAVIFVDLDFFKQINDTYGHHEGDIALRKVGAVLERSVRESDLVARYGGEEFVILLPETNLEQAIMLAERLRFGISTIALPVADEGHRRLTISCGIAAYPETAATADTLLRGADQAMYRAKQEGRNRVITAPLRHVEVA